MNKFPKTIKGYISKVNILDHWVEDLKGFDSLSEDIKDELMNFRSQVAELIDTYKNDSVTNSSDESKETKHKR